VISRLALFALLLCRQDGVPLPAALQADAQTVAAWAAARGDGEPAARREAARLVLERLPLAPARERYDFLLACDGVGLLPADLGPAWLSLAADWPELRARLSASLLGADPLPLDRLRGTLRAAGALALDQAEVVEAIAARLSDARVSAAAAAALLRITGHEFHDGAAFADWWRRARTSGRAQWLADALQAERERTLRHWEELLALDAHWGLQAARDPAAAVRRLGYAALQRLEPPADKPADAPVALVLVEALQRETEPGLRETLIALVPRFLGGAAAFAALDPALASPRESERQRALEQLPLLREPALAWERLLREAWRVHPLDRPVSPASAEYRLALWNALHQTLAADGGFAPAVDAQTIGFLVAVLERLESDVGVRARIYAVSGRVGAAPLRELLALHVADPARAVSDRAAALDAWAGLALRSNEAADLRQALPILLADAVAEVRARAVRACARLGTTQDLELLAQRLALEVEPALVAEILKPLREGASPAILDALLAVIPPPAAEADYARAVQRQIGADFGALERTLETLAARGRHDMAYAMADAFPRAVAAPELLERHDRVLARTQSRWLLSSGEARQGGARALDALAFLGDCERRWPAEQEWPRLGAELALAMNRVEPALAALERLLARADADRVAVFPLGLQAARVAAGGQFVERGLALLDALGPPPEGFAEEAAAVRALFPPPPPAPVAPPGE
jgi:hypothetical protein